MSRQVIGTFEKNGMRRDAYSPAEVVHLKFHGWVPADASAEKAVTEVRTGPTPPPMSGRGSSADEWRRYAQARGVDVPEDADRSAIVDAVRDAGHPVE